ncbi:glycosyltransferase family 2 protein [Bacteroidota bacterium]
MFEIPIALFTFKRKDTVFRILDRIAQVKPKKIYIISDGPRDEHEKDIILDVRASIENYISWDCEIIKNYAEENRGVYRNIGEGAKWVFSLEEKAIFLEDDNLPALTFFKFCQEMLEKYEGDNRILWICGTNYLKEYIPEDGSSYMFTKHMLPCGWASWQDKFNEFYDGKLDLLSEPNIDKRLSNEYEDKSLYRQEIVLMKKTKYTLDNEIRKASWDRQMNFSIRANSLFGISPKYNQIENIGVDDLSVHGGTSFKFTMTKRFCGIKTIPLEFPLKHPKFVLNDKTYEKKIGKVILYPLKSRIKTRIMQFIKPILGVDKYTSYKMHLEKKKEKQNNLQ